jgi:tetratricopeptide (TPR) repeat protein
MTAEHEKLDAFFDGELPPAEAEAFRRHLGECEACARELHERMMLEVVAQPKAPASNVRPIATAPAARKRPPAWALAAVPLAAAAAWLVYAGTRPVEPLASNVDLEVAPTRSLEPRLAYTGADRYRSYDVARGGGAHPGEAVPLATLAALEKAGDLHAEAAGLALSGDVARAERTLDRAPSSSDVAADRGALLLLDGKPKEALAALDAVLAQSPKHPQALFNRALALRDLGRTRESAEAFDAAAALGEAGWSDEAKRRADALRAALPK